MERSGRIDVLKNMLQQEPNDLFANYALGIEFLNNVDTLGEAEKQFKKTLTLDPNYIAAYYQLGKLFESQSNIAEALNYFRSGLEKARLQKNNKSINEFNEAIFLLED